MEPAEAIGIRTAGRQFNATSQPGPSPSSAAGAARIRVAGPRLPLRQAVKQAHRIHASIAVGPAATEMAAAAMAMPIAPAAIAMTETGAAGLAAARPK